MGTFCLILGGPDGDAVLRDRARLAAPYERIGLDDRETAALGIVAALNAANQVWSGDALEPLRVALDERVKALLAIVVDGVAADALRPDLEPWMEQMIDHGQATSRPLQHASRLLELVRLAQGECGTIVCLATEPGPILIPG
jgi:hypothetical protein